VAVEVEEYQVHLKLVSLVVVVLVAMVLPMAVMQHQDKVSVVEMPMVLVVMLQVAEEQVLLVQT
tara:strand:+ start:161 stop:352 length:192 start_codon:yes stop_codon:yes gene_type:complete